MTTATKTPVQQTWNVTKIQEEAVSSMSRHMMTTFSVIEKLGPEAMEKFHAAMTEMKFQHLKKLNAKTPYEVVKALAEFEVNVLGSKISIMGDDKTASMEYEYCACFNAMQKEMPNADPKQKEEMGKCWAKSVDSLAKKLGMSKAEVAFPTPEKAIITFTK